MSGHTIRSITFCSLAMVASALLFAFPANAVTIHAGSDVLYVQSPHHDIAKATHDLSAAMDKLVVQREAAFFLDSDPIPVMGAAGNMRTPFDLKLEYAESYDTDGLNFIGLRRRC